jgi:hypothetical protein
MSEQLTLSFLRDSPHLHPITQPHYSPKSTLQQQFESFHRANPHILSVIIRVALEAKRAGWSHLGIGQIYERLRWLWAIQTQGGEYKLNNNHRSYYARVVMSLVPELSGLFEVRNLRSPYVIDWGALSLVPAHYLRSLPIIHGEMVIEL